MLIKQKDDIKPSEITPEKVYLKRRELMTGTLSLCALAATGGLFGSGVSNATTGLPAWARGSSRPHPTQRLILRKPLRPSRTPAATTTFMNSAPTKATPPNTPVIFKQTLDN